MKRIILSMITVTLVINFIGCSSRATPQLVSGKYYMMGDSNCERYYRINNNTIRCISSDGQYSMRSAMSNQEISMYQHNRQIAQQKSQQLNQTIQNTNNQMNYNNQQMMNRNNIYKFQQVGPYGY